MSSEIWVGALVGAVALTVGVLSRPALARGWRRVRGRARPRSAEQGWRAAQFAELDARAARPTLAFWGDSLLHQIELDEWIDAGGRRIANRAVSGDRTEHLLARLDSTPGGIERSVLLIGANDLLHEGPRRSEDDVASAIAEIADALLERTAAPVRVVALLPLGDRELDARAGGVNERLRERARGAAWELADVGDALRGPGGLLDESCTVDGVHLSPRGMRRLLEALGYHLRT